MMDIHQQNHRPPLKTPLRRESEFSWHSLLGMAVVVAGYATAQYVTELGDAKALRAENAKLQQRIREHTQCRSSFYSYPNIPPVPMPRKDRK